MHLSFLHAASRLMQPVKVAETPPIKERMLLCRSRSSAA
jgi:hypothetical protein